MKTRRFDINYRPLQLQISAAVTGSVPDTQNYNADTQEYTPDYTLTPLIIQPYVSILDKDEVLQAGRVNYKLANIRWTEIIGGAATLIGTDNANYVITTAGTDAGQIKVKKNAAPGAPITLEFYAEYVDARTSQVHVIKLSYPIRCSNASDSIRVELSAAEQSIYNPLSDPETQSVTASVFKGDTICEAAKYVIVWEVLGEDGTWHTVGSDELDYDVTISSNTATVNRRLMGAELYLRARCKYSAEGAPASVALTDATPNAVAAFVRRIPKFEYDFTGVPVNIPNGILFIAPTAIIRTTNGEISNPEKELLPLWYIATNKAGGTLNYTQVAEGVAPIIPTAKMDNTYGAVIGLDVQDRGYYGALTDADGIIITDADGAVIIMH